MKKLSTILKKKPVFLNLFDNAFNVLTEFEGVYMTEQEYKMQDAPYANVEIFQERKQEAKEALEKHKGEKILFASYGCANYEGDAWVLFSKDGRLYEVNGSHCSCYGLEDQWTPEEVFLPELENRLKQGSFGTDSCAGNEFKDELAKFLGVSLP